MQDSAYWFLVIDFNDRPNDEVFCPRRIAKMEIMFHNDTCHTKTCLMCNYLPCIFSRRGWGRGSIRYLLLLQPWQVELKRIPTHPLFHVTMKRVCGWFFSMSWLISRCHYIQECQHFIPIAMKYILLPLVVSHEMKRLFRRQDVLCCISMKEVHYGVVSRPDIQYRPVFVGGHPWLSSYHTFWRLGDWNVTF